MPTEKGFALLAIRVNPKPLNTIYFIGAYGEFEMEILEFRAIKWFIDETLILPRLVITYSPECSKVEIHGKRIHLRELLRGLGAATI